MSTRGAYGFKINNELYMLYNAYDSYPEGLGKEFFLILNKNRDKLPLIKKSLLESENVVLSENGAKNLEYQSVIDTYDEKYSMTIDSSFNIFLDLADNKIDVFLNDRQFINDTLFCEYYYYYNFDTEKFVIGGDNARGSFSLDDTFDITKLSV